MIKVGLTSFAYRWAFKSGMTPAQFLDQALEDGAEVVQLCENSGYETWGTETLNQFAIQAKNNGLVVECGSSGADLERMKAGILKTKTLGGTLFRCVLDSDGKEPEEVVRNLQALGPLLNDTGVTFCAENHFRFTPKTLRWILEQVHHPSIAVCLDPLNSISQLVGPGEVERELLNLTRTAHVKDARITRAGTGFVLQGTPLGEGQVDLVLYLKAVQPKVTSVLLESWMDPLDDHQATLHQEIEWTKRGLAFIKNTLRGVSR